MRIPKWVPLWIIKIFFRVEEYTPIETPTPVPGGGIPPYLESSHFLLLKEKTK